MALKRDSCANAGGNCHSQLPSETNQMENNNQFYNRIDSIASDRKQKMSEYWNIPIYWQSICFRHCIHTTSDRACAEQRIVHFFAIIARSRSHFQFHILFIHFHLIKCQSPPFHSGILKMYGRTAQYQRHTRSEYNGTQGKHKIGRR